jgi:prepilin-type N-terminal cleavage/methylation domain-containing protein
MKLEVGNWKLGTGASAPASELRGLPAFNPQPSAFSLSRARRAGFTLMELLLVMVVIAILGTIIMGSAGFITRLARVRRAEVTCRVLETALSRYRSDYDKWPVGSSSPGSYIISKTGKNNQEIFGALREANRSQNPRGIRYLDESTVYTVDGKGNPVTLDKQDEEGALPLVYVTREGARAKYFKVVIDVDKDTVKVEAPELYE